MKNFESESLQLLHQYQKELEKEKFTNLFFYIDNDGNNICELVNAFMLNTNDHSGFPSYQSFFSTEELLLNAIVHYIYHEAPYAEWNLFMVQELIMCSISSDEYEETDLDLLFNHKKESNPESQAVSFYDKYKGKVGKTNMVVLSCMSRLKPLYASDVGIFDNISCSDDIFTLASALAMNLQNENGNEDFLTEEKMLFSTILLFIYEHTKDAQKITHRSALELLNVDVLNKAFSKTRETNRNNPSLSYYDQYCSSVDNETNRLVAESCKQKLSFFAEYSDDEKSEGDDAFIAFLSDYAK